MNKAKTTMNKIQLKRLAFQWGIRYEAFEDLEAFHKACIADYVSRCELVAWQDKFRNVIKDDARKNYIKMNCQIGHAGYDIPLFTLPNDGE